MNKIQDALAEAADLQKALDKVDEKRLKAMDKFNAERIELLNAASAAAKAILDAAALELA
jgi:F0F1-type ATP synthase membrane subunit b/b'